MLGKLRTRKGNRTETPESAFQPVDIVEQHGDYLFRFAVSRVRNEALAEDLVQETFLAALKQLHAFSNRCSMRTWLTSILKNKIFDHIQIIIERTSGCGGCKEGRVLGGNARSFRRLEPFW